MRRSSDGEDPGKTGERRIVLGNEPRFRLGPLLIEPRQRRIQHDDGRSEFLEPRVMQVLVALVRAGDVFLTRDDLAFSCWEGRIVGDDAINRTLSRLRRVTEGIGADAFRIETLSKVGYRIVTDARESRAWRAASASREPTRRRILPPVLIVGGFLMIGLLIWRPWQAATTVSVQVVPASASPEAEAFARDVSVKLAMLGSQNKGLTRLLDRTSGQKPELEFEIDASADGSEVESSIVLLNDKRELLWSKDFRQPRAKLSDLKQELAVTSAKVLDCALETVADRSLTFDQRIFKRYLNGCAASADLNENNLREIEGLFTRVVAMAPAFQPGWKKLLLVQAEVLDYFDRPELDLDRARKTVAAAQKIDPAIPEIYIVQAAIAPPLALTDRIRFVEEARRRAPDDAHIAMIYAEYLVKVGRVHDAAVEATRSVHLDPLSPANRQTEVILLGTDGRIAEAERELRQADALWPGAVSLRLARYTLHLRVADPKEAIRLRDSGLPMPSLSPFQGSFLTARANPTPANVDSALRDARALFARDPIAITHLSQTLGAFHREEELFSILLNWQYPDEDDQVTDVLFRPAFRNIWRDPRFMRVAARLGLLQYWQISGKWPDFCFESDLPYDCKREAAAIVTH